MMSIAKRSLVFIALTFVFSWGVTIGAWAFGLHNNASTTFFILTAMMFGPALAAIVCVVAFEQGNRLEALGLRFAPNLWWLYAWLIPLAIAAGSTVLTVVLTGRGFADPGAATIATLAAQVGEAKADQLRAIPMLGAVIVGVSVFVGPLLNAPVLAVSEELGWRGYLHHLWRPAGFWRASLATGAVWGVWHAPAIYLLGLNYPADREVGVVIFILFCMLLAPIMTLVRDRGGSVWAAGITHGAINATAGLTVLAIANPTFPWQGLIGVGGYLALGLGVVAVALGARRKFDT